MSLTIGQNTTEERINDPEDRKEENTYTDAPKDRNGEIQKTV